MHRVTVKTLGLALLAAVTLPAFALPTAPAAPVGFYAEANVGSSHVSGKYYPGDPSRSGVGGGGNVGYKFMRYFATEIGYTIYDETTINNNALNTEAAFDRHWSYDLAFKGMYPIPCSAFELFGKLGIAQIKSSMGILNSGAASSLNLGPNSHTATGLFFGGGAAYYFSPQMGLNVQYARAQGNSSTGNGSLFSGGLTLIFA